MTTIAKTEKTSSHWRKYWCSRLNKNIVIYYEKFIDGNKNETVRQLKCSEYSNCLGSGCVAVGGKKKLWD